MKQLMGHFSIFGNSGSCMFALAYAYAGLNGLFAAAVLAVLEVSFSFDNAVVNAGILNIESLLAYYFLDTWYGGSRFGCACCSHWFVVSQTSDMSIASAWNLH